MFSTRLVALTVAGALTLAACGSGGSGGAAASDGPVKVGVVVPLTGPFSPLGIGDKAAIEQEVARINEEGGVLGGRTLEVTIKDDKTDVPQSVTEYNKMAADQGYTAILSSSNVAASAAIGPSAESNKIPTIALGPVSPFKDGSNKYAFTAVAIPELYGEAMVDYLAAEGFETLAIAATTEDPYGSLGRKATIEAAEAAGIDVVVDEKIDVAATDFTPVISKVKAAKPDGFMVWVAGPAAVIITKQMAGSGIPLLLTGAQASNLYIEPAGQEAEGVTMTSSIAVPGRELPDGALKDAVDAFADPWLEDNDGVYPPQFAFDGAAAVQLIVAAIEEAGTSEREKVREALENLDVLTPIGRFTFSAEDHGGLGKEAIAIVTVTDGELKATPYSLDQWATNLPE